MRGSKPIIVSGVLRGCEGETRHVCWQCPECLEWYSDDHHAELENPYVTACGWTRKHPSGKVVEVAVKWVRESS